MPATRTYTTQGMYATRTRTVLRRDVSWMLHAATPVVDASHPVAPKVRKREGRGAEKRLRARPVPFLFSPSKKQRGVPVFTKLRKQAGKPTRIRQPVVAPFLFSQSTQPVQSYESLLKLRKRKPEKKLTTRIRRVGFVHSADEDVQSVPLGKRRRLDKGAGHRRRQFVNPTILTPTRQQSGIEWYRPPWRQVVNKPVAGRVFRVQAFVFSPAVQASVAVDDFSFHSAFAVNIPESEFRKSTPEAAFKNNVPEFEFE